MIIPTTPLYWVEEATVKNDVLARPATVDAGRPNAFHQFENLRNHYYGAQQARPIGRTNPVVKKTVIPQVNHTTGFGSTYRLNDEALRQYSLGVYIESARLSYFKLAKR